MNLRKTLPLISLEASIHIYIPVNDKGLYNLHYAGRLGPMAFEVWRYIADREVEKVIPVYDASLGVSRFEIYLK